MPDMNRLMPVLARAGGNWVGTYTHISPSREVIESYEVRCHSEFPSDGSSDYRLTTHNIWPDGRETRASYGADWRNGRLEWMGELVGWIAEVDDMTLYLRFGYRSDPSIQVCEMIQVAKDGRSRARTWHWFRDDLLFKITLTDERRAD